MSTNLNYKQAQNVDRRTWNLQEYEEKARSRREGEAEASAGAGDGGNNKRRKLAGGAAPASAGNGNGSGTEKEEFVPAQQGAIGPEGSNRAYLKARKAKVADIDAKVGSSEIISAELAAKTRLSSADVAGAAGAVSKEGNGVVKTGVGWHCRVCDCFLKDSHTYLDHINGRKHQRALGFSMRVERSTKDQLAAKLAQLSEQKQRQLESKKDDGDLEEAAVNYRDVVAVKDEEARLRKEERRRKRQERKRRLREEKADFGRGEKEVKEEEEGQQQSADEDAGQRPVGEGDVSGEAGEGGEEEEDEAIEGQVDPAMAAMMGFSGFGGGGK